jgi:hypothetical protein
MVIPKVIHKVIIVDGGEMPDIPEGMKKALETWYRMNPGYKVKLYSGKDCEAYIREHFDEEILDAYRTLKPYAYKSDLMRQLILYKEGGWYTDARMVCLEPLDSLNRFGKEFYVCIDKPQQQLCMCNGFIGSVANHPVSKKMIDLILWNIKQRHYGIDCLSPTGPGAYIHASIDYIRKFHDKCLVGEHTFVDGEQVIRFHNSRVVKVKYNNAKGADNNDIIGGNDYGHMWRMGDVYLNSDLTNSSP